MSQPPKEHMNTEDKKCIACGLGNADENGYCDLHNLHSAATVNPTPTQDTHNEQPSGSNNINAPMTSGYMVPLDTHKEEFDNFYDITERLAVLNQLSPEKRPKEVSALIEKNKRLFYDFIINLLSTQKQAYKREVMSLIPTVREIDENDTPEVVARNEGAKYMRDQIIKALSEIE